MKAIINIYIDKGNKIRPMYRGVRARRYICPINFWTIFVIKILKLNNGATCRASDFLVAALILNPAIIVKDLSYCSMNVTSQKIAQINTLRAIIDDS